MKRDQFTFYRSYYEALRNLPQKERAKAVMAICSYALDEELPELSGVALSVFTLIRPTLDSGRKKAENRKNKTKTKQEQNSKEREKEVEKECKGEKERENDSSLPLTPSRQPKPPDWGFGPELTAALSDWLRYKREKREAYKPTGEASLVAQVRNRALEHGEAAVADLIRRSMSSNYKGIVWDWLEKPAPKPNGPQKVPCGSAGQGELSDLERRALAQMLREDEP